eukprot:gene1950-17488_t
MNAEILNNNPFVTGPNDLDGGANNKSKLLDSSDDEDYYVNIEETQLLLTTFQMRIFVFRVRKQSKLYISNDDGEIFNPVGGKLKDVDIRTTFGVVKSERNPLKVILIGFSRSLQSSTLYISVDGAKKWNAVSIPFRVRQDEPIIPHPSKEEWLLALEDGPSMAVWLSIDFGFNWMKMKDQAYSVKWGAVTGRDADERVIFVTVKESMAGNSDCIWQCPVMLLKYPCDLSVPHRIFVGHESALWRSKDLGKSFSLLHDHVYSLGIQGVFLFISVDLDKKAGLRVMHVSKNNGDVFHRVHVPEVTPERFIIMPGTHPNPSEQNSKYTEARLKKAIQDLKDGCSIRKASKSNGIPTTNGIRIFKGSYHQRPRNLELNRASACRKEVVFGWFDGFEEFLNEQGITCPDQIFNCDESGFPLQACSSKKPSNMVTASTSSTTATCTHSSTAATPVEQEFPKAKSTPTKPNEVNTHPVYQSLSRIEEVSDYLKRGLARDTGKGTLFVSDADGIMYSQSLENHFYTNDGITDFFRVESMRGVFLTHQLQEGNTLNSLITFDRGATWNALYLADEQCRGAISKKDSKCSLHYHHTFSQQKGHLVQGPLSSASALGIIMLHGVPGDALHTNNTSVYLSRNGGYNWTKVIT